ncbi:MAG TPA: pyruvate dehydrogenase (acetyl-transferring) E1 component subunit alpha [Terriglobia bacterium]|nr:pyruvate dehydrogenase (acetyl-transferring) E1 component subunit alpha [Terriglobia bacterium]
MELSDTAVSAANGIEDHVPEHAGPTQEERARRTEPAVLRNLLEQMLLVRRFEERAAELYTLGKIGGFCHLYIGQEAVGIGAISTLHKDDYILVSYREHGHALARGVDPGEVMAELYGKQSGVSEGKGGSMHLFDKGRGFLGGHGIVGGQIPLATGVAFASKYLKQPRVTLCFFGEAAVNIGSFHESLNLAALWKLPVVYICENNRFGMGTPIERSSALYDLSQKALGYNMARAQVDGMDVLAVRDVMAEAVERARKENAPTLIEARTYRFMGHSMSDPVHGHYRTKVEVEEQKRHDPIKIFTTTLESLGLITQEEVEEMDRKVKEIVEDAVAYSERSDDPHPSQLHTDVYTP